LLWSGAVLTLVKTREAIEARALAAALARASGMVATEKGSRTNTPKKGKSRTAMSDVDVDENGVKVKSDTEEENEFNVHMPAGFTGMWSERMHRRLEAWAG
jgi:hypothetical protein